MDLSETDTETLVVVRETVNEDNDPITASTHRLDGCRAVTRLPSPDSYVTGERVLSTLDVRHPDRTADIRATDRVRRTGEPTDERPRWTVEGEPARSPFPEGGVVFVLQAERG